MQRITITASSPYEVLVGSGLLSQAGTEIRRISHAIRVMMVTDDQVGLLYGQQVRKSLEQAGFLVSCFVFPHGEASKNLETTAQLYEAMVRHHLTRSDLVVALGGGVVGDLAGFAAATFLRGIDLVQLPTTLLAQIDSSVGGKTAVDLPSGKNLVGAFWQPKLVLCDILALSTLPEKTLYDGMAEAIKYAMIGCPKLIPLLKESQGRMEEIVAQCIKEKQRLVEEDERDTGARLLLNFGHTIGHAIEQHYHYQKYTHGQAVAIGMVMMTSLASRFSPPDEQVMPTLLELLNRYSLPTWDEANPQQLAKVALGDKKRQLDTIRLVVVPKVGESNIIPMPVSRFMELMSEGLEQ